jgi:hypothetical protein
LELKRSSVSAPAAFSIVSKTDSPSKTIKVKVKIGYCISSEYSRGEQYITIPINSPAHSLSVKVSST